MNSIKDLANLDSQEVRGLRAKYIRDKILGLSRNKFSKRHKDLEITVSTLQNWEDARYGGLTEKGARKLIEAYAREGIKCSLQWLLFGIGEAPPEVRDYNLILSSTPTNKTSNELHTDYAVIVTDEDSILKELRYFHELHANALDAIVSDDGLSPYFEPGDCVAGIRLVGQEMNKAIGLHCIIQTHSGQMLVRKLEAGTEPNCYTLICTNPHTYVAKPKLLNIKLFSIAPIIWLRKPLKI